MSTPPLCQRRLPNSPSLYESRGGSPQIGEWATEHPVLLFDFGRSFHGLLRLDRWLQQQPVHSVPWDPDAAREQIMSDVHQALDSADGPMHVRIQGERGVGKTRLALEVFRDDRELVIYAAIPPDASLFDWMAAHPTAHAILVVDECDVEQAATLEQWARMSGRRLRLVTVGHTAFPGAQRYCQELWNEPDQAAVSPSSTRSSRSTRTPS